MVQLGFDRGGRYPLAVTSLRSNLSMLPAFLQAGSMGLFVQIAKNQFS